MSATIRFENASDASAISTVIEVAFRGHPHSDGSEPRHEMAQIHSRKLIRRSVIMRNAVPIKGVLATFSRT